MVSANRNLCNFTMMTLSFTSFLKYDEVADLRLRDIVYNVDYVKLLIRKSKPDQFQEEAWVIIEKS